MPKARTITLTLDAEVLAEARQLAATEGLSLSALLRTALMRRVQCQPVYATARDAALHRLRGASSLGFDAPWSRDETHDRERLRAKP